MTLTNGFGKTEAKQELERLKNDPAHFAEKYLGVELRWYQKLYLRRRNVMTLIPGKVKLHGVKPAATTPRPPPPLSQNAKKREVYSNCCYCIKELGTGDTIIAVQQHFYCSNRCLEKDKRTIKLGG